MAHQDTIQNNFCKLVDVLRTPSLESVLDYLYETRVITDDEYEEVRAEKTWGNKARSLLRCLAKNVSRDDIWAAFLKALEHAEISTEDLREVSEEDAFEADDSHAPSKRKHQSKTPHHGNHKRQKFEADGTEPDFNDKTLTINNEDQKDSTENNHTFDDDTAENTSEEFVEGDTSESTPLAHLAYGQRVNIKFRVCSVKLDRGKNDNELNYLHVKLANERGETTGKAFTNLAVKFHGLLKHLEGKSVNIRNGKVCRASPGYEEYGDYLLLDEDSYIEKLKGSVAMKPPRATTLDKLGPAFGTPISLQDCLVIASKTYVNPNCVEVSDLLIFQNSTVKRLHVFPKSSHDISIPFIIDISSARVLRLGDRKYLECHPNRIELAKTTKDLLLQQWEDQKDTFNVEQELNIFEECKNLSTAIKYANKLKNTDEMYLQINATVTDARYKDGINAAFLYKGCTNNQCLKGVEKNPDGRYYCKNCNEYLYDFRWLYKLKVDLYDEEGSTLSVKAFDGTAPSLLKGCKADEMARMYDVKDKKALSVFRQLRRSKVVLHVKAFLCNGKQEYSVLEVMKIDLV